MIKADHFIKDWKDFSYEFITNNEKWNEWYNDKSYGVWTAKFLGGKTSSNKDCPLGEFFKLLYGDNFRYRREDGTFDLSFTFAKDYHNMPRAIGNKSEPLSTIDYPSSYDVVIEVENYIDACWQEMAKLTWLRCPLKVLVTYNDNNTNRKSENAILRERFERIICQSVSRFADVEGTEYVLLIGHDTNKLLEWSAYVFNEKGKLVSQQ